MSQKTRYSKYLPAAAAGGAVYLALESVPASAAGTVPQEVQTAIDNTTATIQALAPIALAAIAAALIPFGSSLALSFVHKIMAKM